MFLYSFTDELIKIASSEYGRSAYGNKIKSEAKRLTDASNKVPWSTSAISGGMKSVNNELSKVPHSSAALAGASRATKNWNADRSAEAGTIAARRAVSTAKTEGARRSAEQVRLKKKSIGANVVKGVDWVSD